MSRVSSQRDGALAAVCVVSPGGAGPGRGRGRGPSLGWRALRRSAASGGTVPRRLSRSSMTERADAVFVGSVYPGARVSLQIRNISHFKGAAESRQGAVLCLSDIETKSPSSAEEQILNMAAAGVIEPSDSPWASPAVLVKKKDNSWRFFVDYRRLNAARQAASPPVLQTALITAPVLAYPDANRPFILDMDSSNVGVGAVLSQQSDNGEQEARAQLAPTVATLQAIDGEAGCLPLSPAQVQEEQERDAALIHVRSWLAAGKQPEWAYVAALDTETRVYHSQWAVWFWLSVRSPRSGGLGLSNRLPARGKKSSHGSRLLCSAEKEKNDPRRDQPTGKNNGFSRYHRLQTEGGALGVTAPVYAVHVRGGNGGAARRARSLPSCFRERTQVS
ncbi:hypothetical protein AAFF_G00334580 [Aldrovandia affinis]|uniref:Reverse transcriptase/retrotransposon-derived protein RNase H-like domain-containing protein n=1 Tax=Aldrovandia affinis TaxID=143900 RepID=A0AAD7WPU7_9TELE|nr:hypothetical protein AAFF_G00334580 [Aldrovandia affinis]